MPDWVLVTATYMLRVAALVCVAFAVWHLFN